MTDTLEGLVRDWANAYTEEVLDFAQPPTVNDSEVFADVYHSLIHSPLSETLLQLEATYAMSVETLCRERDGRLSEMEDRHAREMSETVAAATNDKNPGPGSVSEHDVNSLASHQMDEKQLLISKFESELDNLHQEQYREFRRWVMTVHEEFKTSGGLPGVFPRSESSFSVSSQPEILSLQESFTVTLGSQMKQMHNLRVSAAHVLDLCRYTPGEEGLPQRLQTSMSLYSNNLCGLVLLTESRSVQSRSGLESDLADLTMRSTEFHFPRLEQQLEKVRSELKKAAIWRQDFHKKKAIAESQLCGEPVVEVNNDFSVLQVGDFYLTKHSNLCETHVIFHMVVDDSLDNGNISSRHPVIMGLRNLLKTACLNDVTTLTIPLLLGHKMTEKMTVAWCVKRAELVFKCIKGFMMEMGGWGGSEIKTLQFLLPVDIDQDVFVKLTSMLSTIFRVSNPIRGS